MAKEQPTDPATPLDLSQPATLSDLIQLLSANNAGGNEQLVKAFSEAMKLNAPRRKVSIAEYDPKTPWHPDKTKALKLTRVCFQNGIQIREENIANADIALLNRIDRSGRYIDRLVEVILRDDGAEDTVEIRYKNKTPDQRNDIMRRVRSFEDMLNQIVTAQDAAEAELAAMGRPSTKRRRPFVDAPSDVVITG
jgi:hypothetical protein